MPLFTTGDGSDEAVLFVTLQLVTPLWFRRSLIQAIVLMTQPGNWTEYGDATVQFATDKATEMLNSMVFNEAPPPMREIGEIVMFGSDSAYPSGWLKCDGSAVSRTTYADLFAVIGTTFGVGDGSTTFQLPDMSGRFPVGEKFIPFVYDYDLGATGGEEKHQLTVSEMPSHNHTGVVSPNNPVSNRAVVSSGGVQTVRTAGTSDDTGANAYHENRPPYLAVEFMIYSGVAA